MDKMISNRMVSDSSTGVWSLTRCATALGNNVLRLALILLAGCGGGDGDGQSSTSASTPTPAPAPTPPPVAPATLSYLHVFGILPIDGQRPGWPLLQASDGHFYGVTGLGGMPFCRMPDPIPCGTIFRLKSTGEESVFYNFGSSDAYGYTPRGALIQGRDGALYGVTANGGRYGGGGTVFKITLDGVYTVLHSFGGFPSDGLVPVGGLVQASNGDFYGTTFSGGANHCVQIPQGAGNCGTVFKMTPDGAVTIIYSFGATPSDGVTPGPLLLASDGNLYGTTVNGGAHSCSTSMTQEPNTCGTVFKITPSGVATVLHSFGTTRADGKFPQGPLIEGRDGAFYGTTAQGGGGSCGEIFDCGTVFRITPAGEVTILYAFGAISGAGINPKTDGYGAAPYLIQGRDGNFYGTTYSGGAYFGDLTGTVFKLTPSGVKTILYSFGPLNVNPSGPEGGVIEGSDGALYGTTGYNGNYGASGDRTGTGTIYRLMRN